jgi:hypothetical protein
MEYDGRQSKFRQAAFVYLHVAILYEAAAWVMLRQGMLPARIGPPAVWLVVGALFAGAVFAGLYFWQNRWVARGVWVLHGLRLPALINGAFFAGPTARLPSGFYIAAMVAVVINLWMLARAGWDL